jgi:hypothetical protein
MPPADDDRNARQIEALRRYVAELGTNRERPESETGYEYEKEAQPATRENGQGPSAEEPSGTAQATTLKAPVASPECKAAVDQANVSLTAAVKVRGVLGEYTKVMDDLRNGRIDGRQAAAQISPYLALGTVESDKFDRAIADYQKIVDKCTLRVP